MSWRALVLVAVLAPIATVSGQQTGMQLYAAGSLRAAMTEVVQAFNAAGGGTVSATYGASGLLRERIEKGAPAEVFASADMSNPQALARAGRAAEPTVFARNQLCALAAPGLVLNSAGLLDRMLDPQIKLGTSTPKADPSGDYAWQLFEKAESLRPGAFRILDAKALKLTGGPDSPPPPADRSVYGVLVAERKVDIFLTYCTNALVAVREVPGATMIPVPDSLAVGAAYGVTTLSGASSEARRFADFVVSPAAQAIFVRHGFTAARAP